MKLITLTTFVVLFSYFGLSQNPGDTVVVNTFNYTQTAGAGIRDTVIDFPDVPGVTWEKIIMKYNMRCKDGLVSPAISGQTNIGCGEWDYSCNTYIHDSARVDSLASKTPSHIIPSFGGTTLDYTNTPTYSVYQHLQQNVTLNSITSEVQSTIGTGVIPNPNVIATEQFSGKSQYLFTAAELTTAGVVTGDLHGFLLDLVSGSNQSDFLRVNVKHTTNTDLTGAAPDLTGWTNVFFQNTTFVPGLNRIQFYQPFAWDGTSNIVIEVSFNNGSLGTALNFVSHDALSAKGLVSSGDYFPLFNGANYYEADTYTGITGTTARTIEAWIKTSVGDKEIVSWGTDANGQKWVFRLDNTGKLRLEVNGAGTVGTADLRDDQWHHVVMRFQGNNVSAVQFYVDGVLEPLSAVGNNAVNTGTGNKMRISRGVNNRYWDGEIDNVRVWSAYLAPTTITDWRHKKLDASHPNFANLEAYFDLNENGGTTISDGSSNGNDMTAVGSFQWDYIRGDELFKDFAETNIRPNIVFFQGTYNVTVTPTTVNDTVAHFPYEVTTNTIVSQAGTINDDIISGSAPADLWEATYNYLIDVNGAVVDSFPVTPQGVINITDLDYYQRWPMKFEIMSFVTPYGINLDMGPTGKTWTFDMTDYTPILKGLKRMTMERGGQRQEDMDIQFLFIAGTPERDVLDIREVWRTESRPYTNIINNTYFEPVNVQLDANGDMFKVRTSVTGHGQQGEFIPQTHFMNVNGGAKEFSWQVWKECAQNPVYPQGGTWIYDRAGWCPGMATNVEHNDITQYVTAGGSVSLDYGVNSASGTSNYIVSNQLVTYGPINNALDASIIDIKQPTDQVEYARDNSICNLPIVTLRNSGSTTMTTAKIKYWVNDVANALTFDWTGTLTEGENVDVELPSPNSLWNSLSQTGNSFFAEVTEVNGGADQYAFNDRHTTTFEIPEVMPSQLIVLFRTNNAGAESSFDIRDDNGQILFSRGGMSNSTTYRDTLDLGLGCFSFNVYDTDGDGISFFANNDGAGYVRFLAMTGQAVRLFESNYGDGFRYNFTSDFPLSYEDINGIESLSVFPNPTNDELNIELHQMGTDVELTLVDNLGKVVRKENHKSKAGLLSEKWNISELPNGIYVLMVSDGKSNQQVKVVKQ